MTQIDDQRVRMVTWEKVCAANAYIAYYQKEGLLSNALHNAELMNVQTERADQYNQYITDIEQKMELKKTQNKMIDIADEPLGGRPASSTNLQKRKPHVFTKNPFARLIKMKVFGHKAPELDKSKSESRIMEAEKLLSEEDLQRGWTPEANSLISSLASSNQFMLGKIARRRDEYDVEYDTGKVKKVKKKRQESRINFDKQEKRVQRGREAGPDTQKEMNRKFSQQKFYKKKVATEGKAK